MLMAGTWTQSQRNKIHFVLIDGSGVEVTGLGITFTLQIGRESSGFATGQGRKFELGLGHYGYEATAAEAAELGPVSIVITHQDIVQQNLEYVVETRAFIASSYTYTLLDNTNQAPIVGATVIITSDIDGIVTIWSGQTDQFGVARKYGDLPLLDPGTYYIWRYHPDYTFDDPDVETVT